MAERKVSYANNLEALLDENEEKVYSLCTYFVVQIIFVTSNMLKGITKSLMETIFKNPYKQLL